MKMKSLFAALLVILAATPALDALDWRANSFLRVTIRPRPEPQDSRLLIKGTHRLIIDGYSFFDVTPFRARILPGELHSDGDWRASCGVGWTWMEPFVDWLLTCKTAVTVEPCESGTWSAHTWARVKFHPTESGEKYHLDGPDQANCDCT